MVLRPPGNRPRPPCERDARSCNSALLFGFLATGAQSRLWEPSQTFLTLLEPQAQRRGSGAMSKRAAYETRERRTALRCLMTTGVSSRTGARDVVASDGFKLVDKSGRGPQQHLPSAVPTAISVVGVGLPPGDYLPGRNCLIPCSACPTARARDTLARL